MTLNWDFISIHVGGFAEKEAKLEEALKTEFLSGAQREAFIHHLVHRDICAIRMMMYLLGSTISEVDRALFFGETVDMLTERYEKLLGVS